jgi:hypothetical protein
MLSSLLLLSTITLWLVPEANSYSLVVCLVYISLRLLVEQLARINQAYGHGALILLSSCFANLYCFCVKAYVKFDNSYHPCVQFVLDVM